MPLQFPGIERNAHRHPLHHLDPVAGGVLRRQQGERAARARREAEHLAVIEDLVAVHVRCHGRGLSDADVPEFGFLEVGLDPELVERHDREQGHAGRHVGAQLHAALGDVARHRRQDRVAAGGEPGLDEIGLRRQHARIVPQAHPGDAGLDRVRLPDRDVERRPGIVHRLPGVRDILSGDAMVRRQRRAAREIVDRVVQLLLLQCDRGGVLRDEAIALAQLPDRLAQVRCRLAQRDLGVGRVEPDHDRAGLHQLRFVGQYLLHVAAHLRRQRDQVAGDIGVIGLFPLRQHQRVKKRVGGSRQEE